MGQEGRDEGDVGGRSCSGRVEGKDEKDTGREGGATRHLVERLVGSEAVGGGGGPRRSRSSM